MLRLNFKTSVLLGLALLGFDATRLAAQSAPDRVCTSPSSYQFDQEVTWRFDLSGNSIAVPGETLYFWSWTPKPIPGGAKPMTYESDSVWSITFTPTVMFDTTVAAFENAGNGAFWSSIRTEDFTPVTGTIPYDIKEQLRNGAECWCLEAPADTIPVYYLGGADAELDAAQPLGFRKMRPVFNSVDSSYTGVQEIYTVLPANGLVNFQTKDCADTVIIGGDGAGNAEFTSPSDINVGSAGIKHIVLDMTDSTYTVEHVYGWNVWSNVLPKGPGQETWWAGVDQLDTYEGNGVWSGLINFSAKTAAWNIPRFYFKEAGGSRRLNWVKGTKNQMMFEDEFDAASGKKIQAAYVFNGEYTVTLDMNNLTFNYDRPCVEQDTNRVVFMGSSVCKGYGADQVEEDSSIYEGYAWQYANILEDRANRGVGNDWNTVNVSIGGNNTKDFLNRIERDLWTTCGKYVIIGLSMANEGLLSGGEATFDQFTTNMQAIIDSVRAHNMEPIIMSNYSNKSYQASHYNLIKQMNMQIAQWDVASANLLGAHEDLTGKFLDGLISDPWHPNSAGYTEFAAAIVPSLIDAIAAGMPQPAFIPGAEVAMDKVTENYALTFAPEEQVRSFTLTFDINTNQTGEIASFDSDSGAAQLFISIDDTLEYHRFDGEVMSLGVVVSDDAWHSISLSHYHALGRTLIYVDGVLVGQVDEKMLVSNLALSAEFAPAASYRQLFFHRSGMNPDEIAALHAGTLLKSSLEIYSPLDESDLLANYAQSFNALTKVNYTVNHTFVEAEDYVVALSPVTEVCSEGGLNITDYDAGEWMVWYLTLPSTGDYIVDYRVASATGGADVRFEKAGGAPIYGTITVPSTGDDQSWTTVSHEVTLDGGSQHLAIYSQLGGFNLNWLNIRPVAYASSKTTSIEEQTANTVTMYPNPATELVQFNGVDAQAGVQVYGMDGRVVAQSTGGILDVTALPTGVYIVEVVSEGTTSHHKLKVVK